MERLERTHATHRYPPAAVAAALERISANSLCLLLSLDTYGWRVEYDAIRTVLDAEPPEGASHFEQHAPLLAFGHLFALMDKLWRSIYGIRANRAGGEFLSDKDGYLTSGYKFHKKLELLVSITETEWEQLLGIPDQKALRTHLAALGTDADEVATRLGFASDLPGLIATNMRELNQYVGEMSAITGPSPTTTSLRTLDGQYRHGAPVVYHDTSPSTSDWVAIDEKTADDTRVDTVGVIMLPPDESGASLINLVKYDEEMITGLKIASATLAGLVLRLVRAHLLHLSPGLVRDPLAMIADYDL